MSNIQDFYQVIWSNIKNSDKNFYIDSLKNEKSYKDLYQDIQTFSKIFCDQTNQLTVILAKKNYEHYCAIITTVLSGNTWVPLSFETPLERNLQIIKNLKPKIFIIDEEISEETKLILDDLNIKTFLIKNCLKKTDAKRNCNFNFNFKKIELSMVFFTSGSTGEPKGVKISHEGLSTAVTKIVPLLKISHETWGDYHDLSFVISINILFKCIFTGGTIFCANKLEQLMPCESLIKNRVSCLVTVPSTLARIAKNDKFLDIFASLNTIISCGEPLPIDVMELYLKKKGTNLFNFYGSTELASWIFYHHCKKEDIFTYKNYGYAPIGKMIHGNEIRVTDENLLIVKSPQVTPGYFGEKKNSHLYKYMQEGWFSTGDVVEQIGDEYICKGRYDNQIKLNGYRIHLMDVETQIKKYQNIEDCLCITQEVNGQKIIAAILITKKNVIIEELRFFLINKLSNYMIPRKIFCVKDKPVNKNGKLDRGKLKHFFS